MEDKGVNHSSLLIETKRSTPPSLNFLESLKNGVMVSQIQF